MSPAGGAGTRGRTLPSTAPRPAPGTTPAGPVPLAERAGGPDLARGLALVGIALANLVGWLHGHPWTVLAKQADAAPWDRTADVVIALLADNRGFPLFALLFGYGIGVLHRRSREAGETPGHFRIRMLRRMTVLGAIGVLHGILLFDGDILVGYAVIGTLCAVLATRGRIALPLAAMVTVPMLAVWGWADGVAGLGGGTGHEAAAAATYGESLLIRLGATGRGLAFALVNDLGLLAPMALGALAASVRLLEAVEVHRDLLTPLARWGLGIGLVGALPLTAVMVLDPFHEAIGSVVLLGSLGVLHQLSGLTGALGLAAAAALLAERSRTAASGGLRHAVGALEALGMVSLSAYLAQSVLALILFPPYTLDLGASLGTAGAAALVTAGWLLMLPPAAALRSRGRRGPAEWALRRLSGPVSRAAREGAPA